MKLNLNYKRKLTVFFCFLLLISLCCFQIKYSNPVAVTPENNNPLHINPHDFPLEKIIEEQNIFPVVVIGSGPAALTAALYTSRAKYPTLVITGDTLGGQLTEASNVENFPARPKMAGLDIMNDLKAQAQNFGAQLMLAKVASVNFNTWPFEIKLSNGDTISGLTVIIATGGAQKTLDIPGVKKFWGKGIGVCSICDAPFDTGKDVAIIGGGDTAADRALQLATFANKVLVLVRDKKMKAAQVAQDYLKNNGKVEILYNIEVKEIIGNERVEGVEILDRNTGKTEELPAQSVYFALGFVPQSALFANALDLDDYGFIKIFDHTQETSKKGVFAAGTVEDPRYQKSVTAAGDGGKAGIDAIEFLQAIGITPQYSDSEEVKSNLYKIPRDLEVPVK